MSASLEMYLIIFLTVTIVLLVILSVFLIKLLIDLCKLTTNLNDITTLVKHDIEPTIKELRIALESINSIVKAADTKVNSVKGFASKILGTASIALSGIQGVTGNFWKGVTAGLNIFKRNQTK